MMKSGKKVEIKSLIDVNKKIPKIYEHTTEQVDKTTGEVVSNTHTFVKQVNTREEFVKLFTENIDYVNKNLTDSEIRIYLHAINNLNYNNNFRFDSNFIGYFVSNEIMKKTTVYRHFKSLVEKGVFILANDDLKKEFNIYGNDVYFVHPDLIGKGPFIDLLKLRRIIVQTFDFQNLTMKQEITTETAYNGFEEIANNSNEHEVKQINKTISNDGKHIKTEIVIGEKDNNDIIVDVEAHDEKQEKTLFSEVEEQQKVFEDDVPEHLQRTKFDKKYKDKVEASVARVLKLENDLLKERLALREHYLEIGDIEKASAISMDIR